MKQENSEEEKSRVALLKPSPPPWNFWHALLLLLLIYLMELVFGWLEPLVEPVTREGTAAYLLHAYTSSLLTFVLIALFLRLFRQHTRALGLGRFRFFHLTRGIVAGIIMFILVTALSYLILLVFGEPRTQDFALAVDNADTNWQLALLLILGGAIVPLKEEMLYRGVVYPPLRLANGATVGMFQSALFFAIIHFDFPRFLPIFVGGLYLSWLYERSRSLWPAVIAHGVWNTLMLLFVRL
jgi:membrane protease YdiL (CAAX protease family)